MANHMPLWNNFFIDAANQKMKAWINLYILKRKVIWDIPFHVDSGKSESSWPVMILAMGYFSPLPGNEQHSPCNTLLLENKAKQNKYIYIYMRVCVTIYVHIPVSVRILLINSILKIYLFSYLYNIQRYHLCILMLLIKHYGF